MTGFDTVVVVDWSARSAPSPVKPSKDAIFIGVVRSGRETVGYHRTRQAAIRALTGLLDGERRAGRRALVGFDFAFGYPAGFAEALIGAGDPLALWRWLAERITDDARNRNNRFDVAEQINRSFRTDGPFWGCPAARANQTMLFRKPAYDGFPFSERRRVEQGVPRAKSVFQLMGNGAVGSQSLLGLPYLDALRQRYDGQLSVSPFQAPDAAIVLAEVYPGLIDEAVKAQIAGSDILDAAQVRLLARALSRLPANRLGALLREGDPVEGWILGAGAEEALAALL